MTDATAEKRCSIPRLFWLGAGASHDYGFPLGPALKESILRDAEEFLDWVNSVPPEHTIRDDNFGQCRSAPTKTLYLYVKQRSAREPERYGALSGFFTVEAVKRFSDDLRQTTALSIDRFIFENPSHGTLGRSLIAAHVLLKMYETVLGPRGTLRRFDDTGRQQWYRALAAHITDGALAPSEIENGRLTVVTFNYDLSLDIAMEQLIPLSERYRSADVSKIIRIIHANGKPPHLPDELSNAADYVLQAAPHLHLFRDDASAELQKDREAAKYRVGIADRIFIVGFSFESQNVKNIGLDAIGRKETLSCINYDGDKKIQRLAEKLGIGKIDAGDAATKNYMTITRAISEGFLVR